MQASTLCTHPPSTVPYPLPPYPLHPRSMSGWGEEVLRGPRGSNLSDTRSQASASSPGGHSPTSSPPGSYSTTSSPRASYSPAASSPGSYSHQSTEGRGRPSSLRRQAAATLLQKQLSGLQVGRLLGRGGGLLSHTHTHHTPPAPPRPPAMWFPPQSAERIFEMKPEAVQLGPDGLPPDLHPPGPQATKKKRAGAAASRRRLPRTKAKAKASRSHPWGFDAEGPLPLIAVYMEALELLGARGAGAGAAVGGGGSHSRGTATEDASSAGRGHTTLQVLPPTFTFTVLSHTLPPCFLTPDSHPLALLPHTHLHDPNMTPCIFGPCALHLEPAFLHLLLLQVQAQAAWQPSEQPDAPATTFSFPTSEGSRGSEEAAASAGALGGHRGAGRAHTHAANKSGSSSSGPLACGPAAVQHGSTVDPPSWGGPPAPGPLPPLPSADAEALLEASRILQRLDWLVTAAEVEAAGARGGGSSRDKERLPPPRTAPVHAARRQGAMSGGAAASAAPWAWDPHAQPSGGAGGGGGGGTRSRSAAAAAVATKADDQAGLEGGEEEGWVHPHSLRVWQQVCWGQGGGGREQVGCGQQSADRTCHSSY